MGFLLLMLSINVLLVPLLMLLAGAMMRYCPPKDVNGLMGYRTKRSMQNRETWDFAQRYCGELWLTIGLVMMPIAALAHLPLMNAGEDAIGLWGGAITMLECVVMVVSIWPVEKALKDCFDEHGQRRG